MTEAAETVVTAAPDGYKRSVLSNFSLTLASIVVALVTTPLLTGGLNADEYGVWILVGSTVLYMEILELGFGAATISAISGHLAAGRLSEARTVVATSFWVLAIPGVFALAGCLLISMWFPDWFGLSGQLAHDTRILFILLGVDLALSIPSDTFGGVLIAKQRFDLLNLSLVAVLVAQAIGWGVVLAAGGGLISLGVVTVAISLCGQLWRWVLAHKLLEGIPLHWRHGDRSQAAHYGRQSGWLAITDLNRAVILKVDPLVVGAILGPVSAGVYAVGQKLALLSQRAVAPVTSMFFPHAASLSSTNDLNGLRASLVLSGRAAVGVTTPLVLGVALFAQPLLDLWVGNEFDDAVSVVVLLSCAAGVSAFSAGALMICNGIGAVRLSAAGVATEAAINLGLSIGLGHQYGLTGVAVATLVGSAVGGLLIIVPGCCRRLDTTLSAYFTPLLRAHVPAVAAALIVWLPLREQANHSTVQLLVSGTAVMSAYALVWLFTGLNPAERKRLLRRRTASPG